MVLPEYSAFTEFIILQNTFRLFGKDFSFRAVSYPIFSEYSLSNFIFSQARKGGVPFFTTMLEIYTTSALHYWFMNIH